MIMIMINEEEERKLRWKLKLKKLFQSQNISKVWKSPKSTEADYPMVMKDHFLNEWLLMNNENEKPKVESWNRKKKSKNFQS